MEDGYKKESYGKINGYFVNGFFFIGIYKKNHFECMIKLLLDNQGLAYEYVVHFLPTFPEVNIFKGGSFKRNREGVFKSVFKIGWDNLEIKYKNTVIKVEYNKIGQPKGTTYGVQVYDEIALIVDEEAQNLSKMDAKKILQDFVEDLQMPIVKVMLSVELEDVQDNYVGE